ncbi:MAG: alpha/beta fold hydrolase [Archangium sp.]
MRFLLLFFLSGCAHVYGQDLPAEAERHRAKTDDGIEIELTRYHPKGAAKRLPVVLCHGISANARNMDLDDRVSMARWFAAQGRETWTMSLRATGESTDPKGPVNFDDYWRHDLPAVVEYVKRVSGVEQLDFVGHSMGGLVLYAYLSQGGTGVRTAATMGSPTRIDYGSSIESLINDFGIRIVSPSGALPTSFLAKVGAPLEPLVDDGPIERFFYNPQSTRSDSFQRLLIYGTANVAGGVALQLSAMMRTGEFLSFDKRINYREDLAKVTTPILVVAARMDRIAVTPAVKDGYRALGGPKEWLLITRANGTRGEYGHMDLVIGDRAADEVWSKVLNFFDRHARKEP